MTLAQVLLALAAVPVLALASYLALLTALSLRRPSPPGRAPHVRFDVIVPAHDESHGIAATVASLRALDYPHDLFRVVVVADNCQDDTAGCALTAGAIVRPRHDLTRVGKGHALAYAFDQVLREGLADAVVVVDADTVVSPNLLRAFAARIEDGAMAVQADYSVRNPDASWRARLVAVAFATFHRLRSLARERLAVSCGLRGNGMAFTTALLRAVPYDAYSVVEDVEHGVRLGERGIRVVYAPEAHVFGEMPATEGHSRTQRRRWEDGRRRFALAVVPRLLARALRRRDAVAFDLAMDLIVPPLSTLAAGTAVGLVASVLLWAVAGHFVVVVVPWALCAVALTAYALRGWHLSGTGVRGLLGLAWAPIYVAWKLTLPLRAGRGDKRWVRTPREGES